MTLRVGSLFTGYGGLDLAIGGDLAWYSEIDKAACQVLATHHPNVANLGDITKINWSDVEPVDIITGGYPCQPFSHAGNRKGTNDERHLWPYVLDAICAIRPRLAILENVSGHLSLGFDIVLTDLAKVGLSAQWGTYRASDVGAPHRRERLFIVAYSDGTRRGEHGRGVTIQKELTAIEHDRDDATNTSGDGHGEQLHTGTMAGMEGQATGSAQQRQRSWRKSDSRGVDNAADTKGYRRDGRASKSDTFCDSNLGRFNGPHTTFVRNGNGLARGVDDAADTASTVGGESTLQGTQQGQLGGHARTLWGKYAPAIRRWEAVLDRPAPAPTTPGRNDRPRLNPQFVEWMMGLPQGWVTGHGLSAAQELKMLGNGVVPQQAYAAITQLLERTQP